jgi:hypothetical protein
VKKKHHTRRLHARPVEAGLAVLVQQLIFAEEITPDEAALDLIITHIIDNIRSAPIPKEALE